MDGRSLQPTAVLLDTPGDRPARAVRPRGSDKAETERGVRIVRETFVDLLQTDWGSLEALQAALR